MAKLVYANLETNEEATESIALTLYFDGQPTKDEVVATCKLGVHGLTADTTNEFFEFLTCPTPVSEKAGLVRVQCHPTC